MNAVIERLSSYKTVAPATTMKKIAIGIGMSYPVTVAVPTVSKLLLWGAGGALKAPTVRFSIFAVLVAPAVVLFAVPIGLAMLMYLSKVLAQYKNSAAAAAVLAGCAAAGLLTQWLG